METSWRVLVAGDANVDLILRGDVRPRFGQAEQLLTGSELVLGSSAGIVACGLARLGVSTSLVAHVGDDDFGRFTRDSLVERGVGIDTVIVDPSRSTAISVILSDHDDRAILTNLGAIPDLSPADVMAAAEGVSHVHFASYFLLPLIVDGLPQMLTRLRAAGITTSIDTNWDPSERWDGVAAILPLVDYFMPNLKELRAIGGAIDHDLTGRDDVECARRLATFGPTVVVKAGVDGGWSVAPDGERSEAPGLRVPAVDTTGAGDSFDAGYLAAVGSGIADERMRLRWAAAAGSLSIRANGGTAAQATLAELLEQVGE